MSLDVDIYIVDLIDTPREDIQTLKARGMAVICYFSAGSYEDWRPDADSFPQKVIGEPLDNWPGESWLDISELEALGPIMTARFQIALAKGCDGVDLDNVDGYSNQTGFPLTYEDQITYNRWLADQAHKRGLAVGLKNDLPQYSDLIAEFDFAVNEECFSYQECGPLADFVEAGKAVFVIEYGNDTGEYCSIANSSQFMMVRKNIELDAWSDPCWGD